MALAMLFWLAPLAKDWNVTPSSRFIETSIFFLSVESVALSTVKKRGVDEKSSPFLRSGLFKRESGVRREGTGNGRTFAVVNLNQLIMISAGKTEFDVLWRLQT